MGHEFQIDVREVRLFSGYKWHDLGGFCDHVCEHHGQSVVAWGPDVARYELLECDACGCRAWRDGRYYQERDQNPHRARWWLAQQQWRRPAPGASDAEVADLLDQWAEADEAQLRARSMVTSARTLAERSGDLRRAALRLRSAPGFLNDLRTELLSTFVRQQEQEGLTVVVEPVPMFVWDEGRQWAVMIGPDEAGHWSQVGPEGCSVWLDPIRDLEQLAADLEGDYAELAADPEADETLTEQGVVAAYRAMAAYVRAHTPVDPDG